MPVIPLLQSIARGARLDFVARIANRRRLLIVTYHGLREDSSPARSWLLLPQSEFVKQLEHLCAHYDVVPLDDAVRNSQGGEAQSRPRACITFDDGYRNNFDLALPILQRLSVPATVFLPTGFIGSERVLWTTQLELAMRHGSISDHEQLAHWLGIQRPNTSAENFEFHVSEALKRMSPGARDSILAKAFALFPAVPRVETDPFAFLTWANVRAMEAAGLITFGAHTVNHEIVRNLDDLALHDEIARSVTEVRAQCARPSRVFAYPNGRDVDFDERAGRVLREIGCVAAVSTIEGLNDAAVPPFALRRVSVGASMRLPEFRSRVSGLDSQARRLVRAGS
jgi:peptidoglycan/xylan/chitin deacetylase (PgdA/CDA1 family)